MLSSCHTTLYNAAKEGDAETVRQELAAGAPMNKSDSKANLIWQIPTALITVPLDVVQVAGMPILVTPIAYVLIAGENGRYEGKLKFLTESVFNFGDKTPLEVAYEKGHTAVVDEFAKAGAGVAPDSVAHKQIIFQFDEKLDYSSGFVSGVPEDVGYSLNGEKLQDTLKNFESCWAEHNRRYFGTRCNQRADLTFQETNKYLHKEVHKAVGASQRTVTSFEYTRIDLNKAYICRSKDWYVETGEVCRGGCSYDYYVLKFITPTYGTVRYIDVMDICGLKWVNCYFGRFWLKDAPAPTPAEPAKKAPAKKKGRR